MSSGPMPGWYPDPEAPDRQRFWDGTQWTEARAYPAAAVGAAEAGQPITEEPKSGGRSPWVWIAVIALVAAALLGAAYLYTKRSEEPTPAPVPTLPTPTVTDTVGPTSTPTVTRTATPSVPTGSP